MHRTIVLLLAGAAVSCYGASVTNTTSIDLTVKYWDGALLATRSESDIRNAAQQAALNGTLPLTITYKNITYKYAPIAPCTGAMASENDPSKQKAWQCSKSTPTQCYQPMNTASVSAFSMYITNKPAYTTWNCTGKGEFCCEFECCTKRSFKWLWLILLVAFLFVCGVPCIILGVCCCCCGLFAKLMSKLGKSGNTAKVQNIRSNTPQQQFGTKDYPNYPNAPRPYY